MNNKKTMWIVLGVIVVAGLIWWAVSYNSSHKEAAVTPTPVAETPAPTPVTPAPVSPQAPAASAAYTAALAKYGSNRIQIQSTCQTSPNNMVFKSGTTIMLDNRSAASHVVKVDTKTYTIGAWGFTTALMTTTAKLPHVALVDCDKSQNVASITIEK